MSLRNNRQDERYFFSYDVIINENVFTQGVDISLGGLNVKTETPLPLGEQVKLYVPQFELSLKAEVKFSAPGVGMGMKFIVETKDQWEAVAGIIENLSDFAQDEVKKRAVLVVDDNVKYRQVIMKVLKKEGYSVAEAQDGMDAIRQLNNYPFDAVCLDLEMNRIDGLTLVGLIRSAPEHKGMHLIAVSSTKDDTAKQKILDAGADVFHRKTSRVPGEIIKTLNDIFRKD
jgi:CheY-like chemotaxis protein